jgi:branched-chain amino acid transport system substrate-binding protein
VDLQQAKAIASYAYNILGLRKIAILSERGSHYSESLAEYLSDRFQQLGGEICAKNSFKSTSKDVTKSLRQFKTLAPDAICLPIYYSEAAYISKEVARLKASNILLGGDGWESTTFFELVGDTLEDLQVYITSHFSSEDPRPVVQRFVEDFRKKNGRNPNAICALAYDAGLVLADALARTPQLNRTVLREAINSTNNLEGVTGIITLNEKRDPRKGVYILEAQEDGFHLRVAGMTTN